MNLGLGAVFSKKGYIRGDGERPLLSLDPTFSWKLKSCGVTMEAWSVFQYFSTLTEEAEWNLRNWMHIPSYHQTLVNIPQCRFSRDSCSVSVWRDSLESSGLSICLNYFVERCTLTFYNGCRYTSTHSWPFEDKLPRCSNMHPYCDHKVCLAILLFRCLSSFTTTGLASQQH